MGPKRGFVTVLNARVLQWSSEIQANAAGLKGLVSVSAKPTLPPRTQARARLRREEGRWSSPGDAGGSGRLEQRSTEQRRSALQEERQMTGAGRGMCMNQSVEHSSVSSSLDP